MSSQLPLLLSLRDDASFDNFYEPGNEVAMSHIKNSVSKAMSDGSIYIWGSHCAGKTHLLQAACHEAATHGLRAAYVPFTDAVNFSVRILDGLEHYSLICLDDIDAIAGQKNWEQALFHLYNRVFDTGAQLIFSSSVNLKESQLELPDLLSRLSWGFVFNIQTLTDENKSRALQTRAKLRGFELPDNVVAYLLKRTSRDMNALFELLDELDKASLSAKRRLSIPIVKDWFNRPENIDKMQVETES